MKVPSFRRMVFAVVLPVLVVLCTYFIVRTAVARHVVRAASASNFVPFVAHQQIYFYSMNPAGTLHSTLTIARRSDGTMVSIRSFGPLTRGLYDRTILSTDGSSVDLVDGIRGKTTWPPRSDKYTAEYRRIHLNPPSNCVFGGDTLLQEHGTVLGHPVVVIGHNGVGALHITMWKASDLGCTQLQYRVEKLQPDGSYKLMSEEKTVSLELTEPDPELFSPGESYTEMRPSDLSSKSRAMFGLPNPAGQVTKTDARFDGIYEHDWATHPDWASGQ
ncbi:MAG: hypothetical protein ACRD18_05170 [Terriglobia bacterium]